MYNALNLQVNRGTANSQAAGGDVVSVKQSYKSDIDNLAAILAPGYFTANFGVENGLVQVNDTITLVGTDGTIDGLITSVDPVTISVSASDNIFPSGIFVDTIQPINAADTIHLWTNSTAGVMTLGNAGVIVQTPGGIFSASVITASDGLATQDVAIISGAANLDIGIGLNSGFHTVIGNVNSSVEVPGGVKWTAGTAPGTITSYQQTSGNITFSGPWAAPIIVPFSIRMINDTVLFQCKRVPPTTSVLGVPITAPAGTIPSWAAPTLTIAKLLMVFDNSNASTGILNIFANGSIQINASLSTAAFAATGAAGFENLDFAWDHSA
jgi:hypothetical protein